MVTEDCNQILVAEDNRVLSDVLKFNLLRAGFEVTVAPDGRSAIQQLQERRFGLLITDYQMPGANGEQIIQFARGTLGLSTMPIITCSAKGLELDVERLQNELQVSRVIYKPFSMREIIELIRELKPQSSLLT